MSEFIKVAKKSDIPTDTGFLVHVDGQEIALFQSEGKVYAIHARCPHQGGPMHEGGIYGKMATCPWHGWEFDVTNGKCGFNPAIKLPVFKVKEEGEDIYIQA